MQPLGVSGCVSNVEHTFVCIPPVTIEYGIAGSSLLSQKVIQTRTTRAMGNRHLASLSSRRDAPWFPSLQVVTKTLGSPRLGR